MCRLAGRLILTSSLFAAALFGQSHPVAETSAAKIQLDVNLVQVDAVVTDRNGRPKTDLTAADFAISQDGKSETISGFSYVNAAASVSSAPALAPKADQASHSPQVPGTPVRSIAQPRALIAMLVDDRGLSADSITQVRAALKRFITTRLPADLIAIVRTGAGAPAIPQFTSDPRLLNAAIDSLRFNAASRANATSITPILGRRGWFTERQPRGRATVSGLETIDTISDLIESMEPSPGRKVIAVFSENLTIDAGRRTDPRILASLQRLTDAANRASIIVSVVDPRGVQYTGLSAADEVHGFTNDEQVGIQVERAKEIVSSQEGLAYIAKSTGGQFVHDNNDLGLALQRILGDLAGYYLISYHPDATTFDGARTAPVFHALDVKVLRPGLHVRSRAGFFAVPPAEPRDAFAGALTSAIPGGSLDIRATALFSANQQGEFFNTLLYVDGRSLGEASAPLHVAVLLLDSAGLVIASEERDYTSPPTQNTGGPVLAFRQQIPQPGVYELRAAVQDRASGRIGEDRQIVEAPDLKSGRLAVSSILLESHAEASGAAWALSDQPAGKKDATPESAGRSAAIRSFRSGTSVAYAYVIFNARCGPGKPAEIEAATRIMRDGQEVYRSKPALVDVSNQPDGRRLISRWTTTLGRGLPPGRYRLEVVVADKRAPAKEQTALQSIDFAIE